MVELPCFVKKNRLKVLQYIDTFLPVLLKLTFGAQTMIYQSLYPPIKKNVHTPKVRIKFFELKCDTNQQI